MLSRWESALDCDQLGIFRERTANSYVVLVTIPFWIHPRKTSAHGWIVGLIVNAAAAVTK